MIKLTEKFGARGIKVPWEGVFQFQSKPTWSMLEIVPGVSKKPELRPTCLWVMPQSPTQRDLSSLVINTPKLESANTRLLTLANFPHMKDHFYFLTWNFLTPIEPCLDILLTRNVWQLKSLKHLPLNHFGRWHTWFVCFTWFTCFTWYTCFTRFTCFTCLTWFTCYTWFTFYTRFIWLNSWRK